MAAQEDATPVSGPVLERIAAYPWPRGGVQARGVGGVAEARSVCGWAARQTRLIPTVILHDRRHDKLLANCRGFVQLAATAVLLR